MLAEQLQKDILAAQKSGKTDEVGMLRLFVAAVKNREIEKRGASGGAAAAHASGPLTDDEVREVLTKETKKRKEAIDLYTKGGRADLADKEKAELELIYRYIPREMTQAEVEAELAALMAETPSREFSALMKAAMARMKGRADGRVVAAAIKAKLGG